MDRAIELTLEQEFSLRNFIDQVQQMFREQAQEFLILLHKHMMIREMMYQEIHKTRVEIRSGFSLSIKLPKQSFLGQLSHSLQFNRFR